MSGHGQERQSLKRDCLGETAGYHHTCIAVFLGPVWIRQQRKFVKAGRAFGGEAGRGQDPVANKKTAGVSVGGFAFSSDADDLTSPADRG